MDRILTLMAVSSKVSEYSSTIYVAIALRTMTYIVYVLSYLFRPLSLFPCIFVEGISDYDTRPSFRSCRVEDAPPHPVRNHLVLLAKQNEHVLG